MKMTREEKVLWRVKRFVGPLIGRRDFIVGLAAAGVTLTAAEDLMAVDLKPEEAVWLSVAVFDDATGMITEKDSKVKTVKDFLAKYPMGYMGKKDDGWDVKTGTYDQNKNNGPHTAREWMMWRVLESFRTVDPNGYHDFNQHRGYVVANAAMIGAMAYNYKPYGSNQVKIPETAKAFYEIKQDPIGIKRQETAFGGFCDL
jgi:hypothetical protein